MKPYQPDRASDRPTAEGRREIRSAGGLGPRPRAVRVKNPRAVPLVITRAGTPVSNVIAAQDGLRTIDVRTADPVPMLLNHKVGQVEVQVIHWVGRAFRTVSPSFPLTRILQAEVSVGGFEGLVGMARIFSAAIPPRQGANVG
ncbi:hypothetical protein Bbelb_106220 [Branchiostoma belcheri]|nr:hypothetical protein Bbelb_106220 [Branchiostoma belcheri]